MNKRKIILKGVAVATLALGIPSVIVGCSTNQEQSVEEVIKYEFLNIESCYYSDEGFSVAGIKLIITRGNGKTEEVILTDEMVKKLPDMSSSGKKNVVIEYLNKEYSFQIDVIQEVDPIASYSFSGVKDKYYLNEEFSLDGITLKLSRQSGREDIVYLTNDMISVLPNFATVGNYNIVISYMGRKYSLPVSMDTKENEMLTEFKEFYKKYLETNQNPQSEIKTQINYNTKFLGEEINNVIDLSNIDLDALAGSYNMNETYKNIINSIISNSLNIDSSEIKDIDKQLVEINNLKILKSIANSLTDTNFGVTVYDFLTSVEGKSLVDGYNDILVNTFAITNANGVNKIADLTNDMLESVKNNNFNVKEYINDLNITIQIYTTLDTNTKVAINAFAEQAQNLNMHSVSTFIQEVLKIRTFNVYYVDNENNSVVIDELSYLSEDYKNHIIDLIYNCENMLNGKDFATELTKVEQSVSNLQNIDVILQNYAINKGYFNPDEGVYNGNIWLSGYSVDTWNRAYEYVQIIKFANNNGVLKLAEIVAKELAELTDFTDSQKAILKQFITDIFQRNEPDYQKYIIDICNEFGFDATKYVDAFNAGEHMYILTDLYEMFRSELPEDQSEEAERFLQAVKDWCVLVDEMYLNGYSYEEFMGALHNVVQTMYQALEVDPESVGEEIFQALLRLTDAKTAESAKLHLILKETEFLSKVLIELDVTENLAVLIENYVTDLTSGQEVNHRQYIIDICNECGFDTEKYVTKYDNGEPFYLLRDFFDLSVKIEERPEQERALLTEIRNLHIYIDETMVQGFNDIELINKIHNIANEMRKLGSDVYDVPMLVVVDAVYYLTFTNTTLGEKILTFVGENEVFVEEYTIALLSYVLNIQPETEAYQNLKSYIETTINGIIDNSLSVEQATSDLILFVDENCSEEVKSYIYPTALTLAFVTYDENIDYNELFKFVKLPESIEEIDYNQLFKKIHDSETYLNTMKLSNVKIEYVKDCEGNIIKEIMIVDYDFNFDIMISSVNANMRIIFEINF